MAGVAVATKTVPKLIAASPITRASFPELVHRAVEAVPEEKLYTLGKAWIHDVWAEFIKLPGAPQLTLQQFKDALANDPDIRAFMARADMVGAMNPKDVAASMVRLMSGGYEMATWNFLRKRKLTP